MINSNIKEINSINACGYLTSDEIKLKYINKIQALFCKIK